MIKVIDRHNNGITALFEVAAAIERKWANEWNSHNNLGLSKTHILLLDLLDSKGPLRPSDLAETLHVTTGGVTVLTSKLLKAEYIKKTQNQSDRRASQLEITAEGKQLLEEAYEHIEALVNRMFGMLTADELKTLQVIFMKCLQA
ncbi:RNA polymerase sigma factor [Kurthia sp. 3B1D]|uniref:RNA polymerase sigma factor n=1 Tax=Candidatus Kurthia intestinigallinarum TaxID=1562256 RepID=A0A433RUA3_9BACL|nr:MarR family transcriptional regulator [Kurthia sp. 3B1D]RUS55737.1 RNA polymerase sigma factor [Kurthia sp. 3B1D]